MDPKSPQGMKVLVEVCPLGHQDVPNPDGLLQPVQQAQHVQCAVPVHAGEGSVALGVHLLDIHQQQVRDGHQGQKPGIEEDDIPDPRPVYGAEALQRVDAAIGFRCFHRFVSFLYFCVNTGFPRGGFPCPGGLLLTLRGIYSVSWQVREITSSCCSRVKSINFTA